MVRIFMTMSLIFYFNLRLRTICIFIKRLRSVLKSKVAKLFYEFSKGGNILMLFKVIYLNVTRVLQAIFV